MADTTAADRFYIAAFGLETRVRLRASEASTTGFRGFTLSLIVSQPAIVNGLIDAALDAGMGVPALLRVWWTDSSSQGTLSNRSIELVGMPLAVST